MGAVRFVADRPLKRGDQPRGNLTPKESAARWAAMEPSVEVDYAAEAGTSGRPWPKALKVDPDTHIGRIEDLLAVIDDGWLPNPKRSSRHPVTQKQLKLEAFGQFNSPGYRVMGRAKIARYLGLSERQLSDRLNHDLSYRARIYRVGWLLISDMGLLDELDCVRQLMETAKGRKANSARTTRAGGRRTPGR